MRLVRTRMRRFFVHRVDLIWRYCSLTRGSFYLSANISRVIFFFVRRSWFLAAVTNTGWQKSKASGNGSGSSSRIWLGGRDSNPDSQIQSLESYHWTTSQQMNLNLRKSTTQVNSSILLCRFPFVAFASLPETVCSQDFTHRREHAKGRVKCVANI